MTMTEPTGTVRAALEQKRGLSIDTRRDFVVGDLEVRAAEEGSTIREFSGHACVVGVPYEMYGGPDNGGWMETVTKGAFERTLASAPDVPFKINHEGMTLARTTAGNLDLSVDQIGLKVVARLNTRVSVINDLALLMDEKNINEMSFAFRIRKQRWLTAEGDEVPWWDLSGIDRQIEEVDIHKGDVSVVNYGANPYTDASLRSLVAKMPADQARELQRMCVLAAVTEKRAGATLSAATLTVLQSVLDLVAEADDDLDDALEQLSTLMGVPNPDLPEGGDEPPEENAFHPEVADAHNRAFATTTLLRDALLTPSAARSLGRLS